MKELFVVRPGPRPPGGAAAEHLWGAGCVFDLEGDSTTRDATDWTELTVILKPELIERVDIDPWLGSSSLVLCICSESEDLAQRAANFIAEQSGGELLRKSLPPANHLTTSAERLRVPCVRILAYGPSDA